MLFGTLAVLQAAPEGDPVALIQSLMAALQSKNWAVFVALLIMAVTMITSRLILPRLNIDKKFTPLISAIVGTVFSGGSALVGAAVGLPLTDVLSMLLSGLLSGAAATGLYELLGKYIFPKPADPTEPPQA